MEQSYKNITFLFIAIFMVIFAGFYKTYFGLFPTFDKVTITQHIHSALFMMWFLMLIVQPILIRNKKFVLHRSLGKFSYVLVPLLIGSIFYIAKGFYQKMIVDVPVEKVVSMLFVPFYQIIDFAILYLLAIYHKKFTPYHMRYMIATSMAIVGAAVRRICTKLLGLSSPHAFLYTFVLTDMVLVALIMFDIRYKKDWKPYFISLVIILISQAAYYIVPQTAFWQKWCGLFAETFF
ncbi:MAG: hypothetical protein KBF35_06180 [Saprospiraceae bacterium]|nr:hypothetical protein [Saprospiraceae bacterium]